MIRGRDGSPTGRSDSDAGIAEALSGGSPQKFRIPVMPHPDPDLLALGIQQPWAELILQQAKTVEIRNVPTRVRGRIYLYASQRVSRLPVQLTADHGLDTSALPRGAVVGTVEILDCRPACADDARAACLPAAALEGRYSWRLGEVERLAKPLPAKFVPFGMWFYPFKRLESAPRRRRKRSGV